MSIELKVPDVGESIQEVQIGKWLKQQGDEVKQDENVVELETDKASMDLPAPAGGTLAEILKQDGDLVSVGDIIAYIEEGNVKAPRKHAKDSAEPVDHEQESTTADSPGVRESAPDDESRSTEVSEQEPQEEDRDSDDNSDSEDAASVHVTPSGRRALLKHGVDAEDIDPTGKRIRREDVERHVAREDSAEDSESTSTVNGDSEAEQDESQEREQSEVCELEELVPMSLIRRRISKRLVEAQQKAALLTTFNEIDMSAVIALRKRHQERFQERYQVKLGFMSFFVKATVDSLKQFPAMNAKVCGTDILYRNYYHIGIAIGSEKGLVVPVLRHTERISFAEIEQSIEDFACRARSNKIEPEELQGGTFTISNGGIYGSLLSTPIVNPPQSGVLGMHSIVERPVARNGRVVIRPMMYVALTYDHRIVDGEQAVTCLKRIKEAIEEPARMLVEV